MKGYESLEEQLGLHDGLPYTPKWSAAPDFLQLIVDHCLESKPTVILECGSGITTLMLARCCQINGHGRIYSLEDGRDYVMDTREYLARYQLSARANVIHAPLEKRVVDGSEYLWYETGCIPRTGVEMLVIDGPSGFIQKNSRYPALPLLYDRLAEHCVVFLDDAARADEQEIVKSWKKAHPQVAHSYIETQRGCSIISR